MNSSLDLRVQRSLELLSNLKQTAVRFAKKEDQLAKELTSRRYASNRTTQEAVAAKEPNDVTRAAAAMPNKARGRRARIGSPGAVLRERFNETSA